MLTAAGRDVPHILVIDDDAPILTLFERSLKHGGFQVTGRDTLDMGLAAIALLAPDVLVLDLLFDPRQRGFEHANLGGPFLEKFKADAATVAIPVVICSADIPMLQLLEKRMVGRGVSALSKPCRPAELLAAVRACLPLGKWPDAALPSPGSDSISASGEAAAGVSFRLISSSPANAAPKPL